MLFRDIVGSLRATCFAVVVMCASGVSGMVEDMGLTEDQEIGKFSVLSGEEIDVESMRRAIGVCFPFFLNDQRCAIDKWPPALAKIEGYIQYLNSDEGSPDLRFAYPAIFGICSYAFREVVLFSASEFCDDASRRSLSDLVRLVLRIFRSENVDNSLCSLADDVEKRISSGRDSGVPLITAEDYPLFKLIADRIRPAGEFFYID